MSEQVTDKDTEFDKQCKVMGLFIDNAKTYTQLSGAALALSVTFIREVFGIEKGQPIHSDWSLISSWLCFLISIGAGVSYQYYAVKFLESHSGLRGQRRGFPAILVERPWPLYLIMLVTFYAGAVFFTVAAIKRFQ
jgi:hypothetical protein